MLPTDTPRERDALKGSKLEVDRWGRPESISRTVPFEREDPFVRRSLVLWEGGRWIGNGVSYGPHRDGQRPGGPDPTREQIREDLRLLSRQWSLLRLYGSVGPARTVLEVIEDEGIGMKVMLGVWIAPEERTGKDGQLREEIPEARSANRREVEEAIELANRYPRVVSAICVGNETQVFWSAHRSSPEALVRSVREVRAGVRVPVTVADDFNFWNKPESYPIAEELDFLVLHAHPMWNGLQLEEALAWTRDTYESIRAGHPGQLVVLGEAGWATHKHNEGEQATLIRGRPGEVEQATFYREFTRWAQEARVPSFFFEAFDENWKGGFHPDEVEKHWGLFRADRSPKKALSRD